MASRLDPGDVARRAGYLVRWAVLGAGVGVIAGLSSYAFLRTLDWATKTRLDHPWLIFLLPAFGLVVGLTYHHFGQRALGGNNLLLDEIHTPQAWVPRRMAPLIYVMTAGAHVFGASVGREGAALQLAGGLTDTAARLLRATGETRRLLLITALAGGFGSVFGVPVAGCIFALEVPAVGGLRYDALVPCVVAAALGDRIVVGLGYKFAIIPPLGDVDLTFALAAKIVVAGVAFGLVAMAFTSATHAVHDVMGRFVAWPPLRPVLGGCAVLALTAVAQTRAYLGLSTDLSTLALAGISVALGAFAWKLVFTAVSLGSGFVGGEVTPLFVIGATLGATLAHVLHAPQPLFAALGFVAVFGAAANTPITCAVMGFELFGSGAAVPFLLACVVAYACSPHHGIYGSQRVDVPKAPRRQS